jgi:anti-anti-sigma factor
MGSGTLLRAIPTREPAAGAPSTNAQRSVLMLDGAFDRSNAAQVELALGDAIDADRPQLVIDLRGVSFLDSTMLRVLIQGLGDTAARGAGSP